MAENNTSNIGFEKQIWDAACVLRGNIDASEYKSVVLGLIFLKYISDRFEAKYKELVEEGDGFEEDQDEYTAENIFFVPENARWSAIAAAAHTPEIGAVIDDRGHATYHLAVFERHVIFGFAEFERCILVFSQCVDIIAVQVWYIVGISFVKVIVKLYELLQVIPRFHFLYFYG